MSLEAIIWALKIETDITPSDRLVLITLANFANEDWLSYPKTKTVARWSHIHRDTCRESFRNLERNDLMTRIPWKDAKTGKQTSNVFFLHGGSNGNYIDIEAIERVGGRLVRISACGKSPHVANSHRGHVANDHTPSSSKKINRNKKNQFISHTPFKRTRFHSFNGEVASEASLGMNGQNGYPPEFEKFWQAFPKREGSNPKRKAFKRWRSRVKQKVGIELLLAGAKRYARYCENGGVSEPRYIKGAAVWLSPDEEGWENEWKISGNGHMNGNGRIRPGGARRAKESKSYNEGIIDIE